GVLLNTVATQAVLVSKITELACSISRGNANGQMAANWDLMNASRAQLTQNYFIILQGTQGNDTSVPKATNVCLVQQLKAAMDQYEQLDREALRVAFGDTERLVQLVTMAPPTVDAFEEISLNLNPVCTNSSLPDDDWKAMHAEVAELAVLSQHLAAEFILVRQGQSFNEKKLDSLLVDLETSVRRIMFGSSQPVLAAPPKQTYFDYMLTTLEPAATTLRTACLTGTVETVLTSSDALFSAARTLQEQYLNEVSDPRWPKERVDLAVSQVAVAYQVFKDALLAVLDMAEHDRSSWNRFEEQQKRLSDLTLVERQDIIAKWEAADSAWQVLQGTLLTPEISRTEKALNDLLA
ncbi:AP-4 complex subunit sigma, partial [Durusdinium trenchii]